MNNKELIERPLDNEIHVFDAHEAADALEAADKRIAELERNEGGGCTLAGPGRGDCEHYVGLQDGAVDAYGKPNGWCWSCWKSRRIAELEHKIDEAYKKGYATGEEEAERKLAVAREALKKAEHTYECKARRCKEGDEWIDETKCDCCIGQALAQIGGDDETGKET